MPRTRTAERLAAASNKSTKTNRSDELEQLKEKFEAFSKQFKPFAAALKNYHGSLVELERHRAEVLNQIEIFTKGTVLFDATGKFNKAVVAEPTWAKTYAKNKEPSYCSLQRQLSALNTEYAKQVDEYCIDYINEWEIVVITRIKSTIVKADELKKNWQHYEKKVKQMTDAETKLTEKGKDPDAKAKDKMTRNQEKRDVALEEFEKSATSLCHLIDSALDCAWQDMTPLLYRLMNMEQDRMGGSRLSQALLTTSLSELVAKLKDFAKTHKINLSAPPEPSTKPTSTTTAKERSKSPKRSTGLVGVPKRLKSKD